MEKSSNLSFSCIDRSFRYWNARSFLIPKAQPLLTPVARTAEEGKTKNVINYMALGDSLTEGVGDETQQGGFVPIVAADLQDRYHLANVVTTNYGIAGERSDQIPETSEQRQRIAQ